jgi:asparaginyl-tRNA synthetase
VVLSSLRASLEADGFDEILPAILSERYEPGARHSVAVLGNRALPQIATANGNGSRAVTVTGADSFYLPVSHCVEKQLALEHAERVYCVAPCVRLLMEGEEQTGRHLYTFFQVEVEWRTEHVEEVYRTVEGLLARFSREAMVRLGGTDLLDDGGAARIEALAAIPYERLPFARARQRVADVGGSVNPHAAGDLTHPEERALSEAATAPFWITDYPDGVRDSLYRRKHDGTFATYDLVLPGGHGELATGGLRPASGAEVLREACKFSRSPNTFYADWKARTGVQTGGLGFGLERLIRYCAGASSVLEMRYAHDQGPNARIDR